MFEPGSTAAALDLLCGFSMVLGHEISAAWSVREQGFAEKLELLLEAVLDTAEVITEDHAA